MGLRLARRRLLEGAAAMAGLAACALVPLLERTAPRRVVEAVRSSGYPGRVRPLRAADVLRPAKWGG